MKEAYAIELLFNKEFTDYVRSLWESCSDNSLSNQMRSIKGDVVPHISLGIYEDVSEAEIVSIFNRYKKFDESKAYFESSAVCMFKKTHVTYINVNVNRDMLNYFENVFNFFSAISDKCSPFYLPYVIIPHISIAQCDDFQQAKKCWEHVVDKFVPQKLLMEKIALFKLFFNEERVLVECRKIDEKLLLE